MSSELFRHFNAEYVDAVITVRHNLAEGYFEFTGVVHAKGEGIPERGETMARGETLAEALQQGLDTMFSIEEPPECGAPEES